MAVVNAMTKKVSKYMARCDMAPDYSIGPSHAGISLGTGSHLADSGVQEERQSRLGKSMAECVENLHTPQQ